MVLCMYRHRFLLIFVNLLISQIYQRSIDHLIKRVSGMARATLKLGRVAFIVALLIAVGYVVIFFSVLFVDDKPITNAAEDAKYLAIVKKKQKYDRVERENAELDQELQEVKAQLLEAQKQVAAANAKATEMAITTTESISTSNAAAYRPGVIVLGMHRSGTSIIGGLMNKMGLNTGGPLIRPWKDNEKGFFERIDVVVQNDAIMKKQFVDYAQGTYRYDALKGLKDVLDNFEKATGSFFGEGRQGLKFLNSPSNYPWMLKDPRLCITLRTWIPLLNFVPAVLYTYRHPMDVSMSMHKRETEHFRVQRGLKLWYIYNKRAILQSQDLCRVTTSHSKMMASPQIELDRIYEELRACGVPVPNKAEVADINDFIDIKLQHGHSAEKDHACSDPAAIQNLTPDPKAWIPEDDAGLKLYRACMHLFCALEDGSAYKLEYKFDETVNDA